VLDVSAEAGVYEALDRLLAASGGGFDVPNRTSYWVAPLALHVSVGVALTPVVPFTGLGEAGVPGGSGNGTTIAAVVVTV
jgi:hypothetical protein